MRTKQRRKILMVRLDNASASRLAQFASRLNIPKSTAARILIVDGLRRKACHGQLDTAD